MVSALAKRPAIPLSSHRSPGAAESDDEDVKKLMGLSLRNVRASLLEQDKVLAQEFGEMLFCFGGIRAHYPVAESDGVGMLEKES